MPAKKTTAPAEYVSEALRPMLVPLDQIDQLPGNPRQGDVVAIARSLGVFGLRKNVVVRPAENGRYVFEAGNHTGQAAALLHGWAQRMFSAIHAGDDSALASARTEVIETLGATTVADNLETWTRATVAAGSDDVPFSRIPVSSEAGDDDATALAFALADNRTAVLGEDDPAAVAQILAGLYDRDDSTLADLAAATGYSPEDWEDLRSFYLEDEPEEAAAGVGPGTPLNDQGVSMGLRPQDRAAAYEAAGIRSIVISYELNVYAWLIEKLATVRRKQGVESNAEAVLAAVAAMVGEEPPAVAAPAEPEALDDEDEEGEES